MDAGVGPTLDALLDKRFSFRARNPEMPIECP